MTPPHHASPSEPPEPVPASLRLPKIRASTDTIVSSASTLPYRASNASVSSLFASTSTPTGSRSVSPSGLGTPSRMSGSVFGVTPGEGTQLPSADRPEDPRNLILQAFVPHVAVHTSTDTEELVKDKGFGQGLWELLRPFGERVQGKVTVRDSIGAGKAFEDFAVRFVQLGDGQEAPESVAGSRKSGDGRHPIPNGNKPLPGPVATQRARTGGDIVSIETLVNRHLMHAEDYPNIDAEDYLSVKESRPRSSDLPSPFYTLYLRRLLSGIPLAPHETFSHPVACVIAISSRNTSPIETLRNLYDDTSFGEKRLPPWVNSEYLRYYVLVHDEERDDITKSITLFEQMKRHFGLHCHLLRLRSTQCVATDDDSVELPRCEWLSAQEEMAEIRKRELEEDVEDARLCIFESDTTAVKTFIREMVTQSIIPSMERCIATWNDQVASRRRGFSGRLTNITKKWSVFGGVSKASTNGPPGGRSSGNYEVGLGFYKPETPEAIMRKLADYAFMLRDWKLAQSTYELLRSDFNNDNAWKYHAGANEMAAISTLMNAQSMSIKTRIETIDKWLDAAQYSYNTRCTASYGALRSVALVMELLRLRGGSATADAAQWGQKLLDLKVVGVVGDALIKERVAACYASKKGTGSGMWGARTRKSAFWSIRAADAWLTLGKPHQSKQCLDEAIARYSLLAGKDNLARFVGATEFIQSLQREVQLALYPESGIEGPEGIEDLIDTSIEEESETFTSRPHRRSLMGAVPPLAGLESAPLHGTLLKDHDEPPESDQTRLEDLYSDFAKTRTINPDGYQANTTAWLNGLSHAALAGACPSPSASPSHLTITISSPLLTALETREYGRPSALRAVIQEGIKSRQWIDYNEFMSSERSVYQRGWGRSLGASIPSVGDVLGWGLRQVGLGFVMGEERVRDGRVVVMENLEGVGKSVQKRIVGVRGRVDRIFSREAFREAYGSIEGVARTLSDTDIEVLLRFLEREEGVLVYDATTVKLKAPDSKAATAITEQDMTIASLKTLIKDLEAQTALLSTKIDEFNATAQEAVIKKNRVSALAALRSKKLAETTLTKRHGTLAQLEEVFSSIEQAASQIELVGVMEASAQVLTGLNKEVGGVEKVDDVVEQLREQMALVDEVGNVVVEAGQGHAVVDEQEVDDELEAMEREESKKVEAKERLEREEREKREAGETKRRMDALAEEEKLAREAAAKRETESAKGDSELVGLVKRVSLEPEAEHT
ncbi:putativeTRAPP complex protein TRS85 [Diplocarpon rosae]|nr:putativeTRAPP complex protein TRS85 [Diplocarpon rosae]